MNKVELNRLDSNLNTMKEIIEDYSNNKITKELLSNEVIRLIKNLASFQGSLLRNDEQ